MNYFIYPMKYMRITQNYNGTYSHKSHWYKVTDYKDYPIDEGGKDYNRDWIYCPCDEMKVTNIKGVGDKNTTNTIWLVSTKKVITPTFNDYAFMTLTHSNDSDFKNIKVGTVFKRGDKIVKEGEDGNVASHIHMVFGRGTSNNWIKNSNKEIVIKGNCLKPEEVCYIDKSFTKVLNNGGISWKYKPVIVGNTTSKDENSDQIEVLVNDLRARKSANGEIVGYIKKGIYNILDKKDKDKYTWYKVDSFWIAYSSTWAKLYLKKEKKEEVAIENKEDITDKDAMSLLKKILLFLKNLFNNN